MVRAHGHALNVVNERYRLFEMNQAVSETPMTRCVNRRFQCLSRHVGEQTQTFGAIKSYKNLDNVDNRLVAVNEEGGL